jgi:pimeloyl-ACP methyl ester carboxylesterase
MADGTLHTSKARTDTAQAPAEGLTAAVARNGEIEFCYERIGPVDGKPLLLINGIGMQLIMWREEFCVALADRGFAVARYDQRDVGRSTHLHSAGRPTIAQMLLRPSSAAYTLRDMADDAVSVMDALGWSRAHVVGISMGGMIAQELAIQHRDRVASLTSMMATASPRIGRLSIRTARKLNRLQDRPVADRDDAGQLMVDLFTFMGSPSSDLDEAWLRDAGRRAYDRGYDQAGRLRQEAALMASKDRRAALRTLDLPALVVHGQDDPIWAPVAGRATAEAIPRARLVTFPDLGHGLLPQALWPAVIEEICRLARV